MSIVIAYAGACALLLLYTSKRGSLLDEGQREIIRLLPAFAFSFLVGLIDDLFELTPFKKLVGQLVSAILAIAVGVCITNIGGLTLPVWVAVPVTIIWLVGCANAFNLIDGVDGLAAGLGLFGTITVLVAALLHDNVALALATAPLAGALLGFLRYNFNPATIFLGDCGSLSVGFMLGCFAVLWGQKSTTVLGMTAPLMALSIPLLDTALAIVRRFLRNKPIYEADRGHIHHRLLELGLDPRKVVLLLYGAAAIGATHSVLLTTVHYKYSGLVIAVFCAMAWMGVQHLRYVEFGTAGRMFLDGVFRRHLNSQLSLHSFEESVRTASSPEECWTLIREACKTFGCGEIRACLAGQEFAAWNGNAYHASAWIIRIPLSGGDFVELERYLETRSRVDAVGAFANVIGTTLPSVLSLFSTIEEVGSRSSSSRPCVSSVLENEGKSAPESHKGEPGENRVLLGQEAAELALANTSRKAPVWRSSAPTS
jgi:UDP-GlcNAc:undecaprenyl-phosphate GlcNAc-1-phosphate transferase